MLDVADAQKAVLACARPLPPRRLPLGSALDAALAEDVRADIDLPPFPKALVDGFAVRASDLPGGKGRLFLGEEVFAGRTPTRPIRPGEAAVIMTGAPLPLGADAVVMHERTRRDGDSVEVDDPTIAPGRNWLPRGRELTAGSVVARTGDRLHPARLGLLASVGCVEPLVVPRPTVAVLPTGDELVEPDAAPGPGQIRNSNAAALVALAQSRRAEAGALPIARDDPEELRGYLDVGLRRDVLLITGGVSAGSRDLVPGALEELGVSRVFHKLRLKPGKPLWFGVGPARGEAPGALVFGLPGNPVSGVVGFLLFVAPALEALAGHPPRVPEPRPARLAGPFAHRGDRPTYHPARPVGGPASGEVELLDWAGSADLRTVADAGGFAVFPPGDRDYRPGDPVGYLSAGWWPD